MRNEPKPTDDIIDSRDLLKLLNEKESDTEALFDQWLDEIVEAERESRLERDQPFTDEDKEKFREEQISFENWVEDSEDSDVEEFRSLKAFCEEIDCMSGDSLRDGITIIADSYFENYAQELADDIGDLKGLTSQWPFNHIDWEDAADELKNDYSSVEWDGNEFWIRS